MMSLDLAEVSQCVLPGNNRNEIELQFPESDAVEANNDQLVSIRFYIPPDPEGDPSDRTIKSNAELLQQRIMSTASIRKTTGDVIVEFEHEKGSFLTPRGRYAIELCTLWCCPSESAITNFLKTHSTSHYLSFCFTFFSICSDEHFFRMRGQKYDYKIKYDDISRLFLLPKPDEVHMAFVIALDKPIRQGQQRYQHLVLQTSKDPDEVRVNLDEETIKKDYGDDLQPVMRGSLSNLVAKTFKVIAKKKVFIPGKFSNANQQSCVKCALRANEGLLYPLEKQFVFIHKPPILIRFNEVESVEFQRYAGGQGSTRNFDLCVSLKASASMGNNPQEYVFSGIDRSDYAGLYNFLSGKNISIKNLQDTGVEIATAPVYNEDEIYGGPDEDGEEESEDEDYDEKMAAAEREEDSMSDSDEIDDDEMGSEVDDNLDSDLEEHKSGKRRKTVESEEEDDGPKKKKKKSKKSEAAGSPKKKKGKKDPNAPKRGLSSYMIFMTENRARIKEANPDASFGDLVSIFLPPRCFQLCNVSPSYFIIGSYGSRRIQESRSWGEEGVWRKGELNCYVWELPTTCDKILTLRWNGSKAAEDKRRYEKEMEDYVSPEGMEETKTRKKGKKKKDPNQPKRGFSNFMFYSNAVRAKVKEENPDASFGEIVSSNRMGVHVHGWIPKLTDIICFAMKGKIIGKQFKALSPEEKEKFDELAAKDKERYTKEMAEYQKKQQAGGDDSDGMGDDQDSDESD